MSPRALRVAWVAGLLLALASPVRWLWDALTATEIRLSLVDATARRQASGGLGQSIETLDGAGRLAIFAHPPSRLVWAVRLHRGGHRFHADLGLAEEAWARSDGVDFRVAVLDRGEEREIGRWRIGRPATPRWRPVEGGFSASGEELLIVLETAAGRGDDFDWALWGEPRVRAETAPPSLLPTLLGAVLLALTLVWGRRRPPPVVPRLGTVTGAVLSVATSLLLLELVLRLFPLLLPYAVYDQLPEGGARAFPEASQLERFDAELGYLTAPGRRWTYRRGIHESFLGSVSPAYWKPDPETIRFVTDGDGFRNAPGLEDAEVVAVGDSFVQAGMVAHDDAFTSVLARASGRRVRNLGVGGYAPQQSLLVLERYGLSAPAAKLVVWVFYEGNDVADAEQYLRFRASGMSWPRFVATSSRLEKGSRVIRRLDRSRVVAVLRHLAAIAARAAGREPVRVRKLDGGAFNPVCGELAGRPTCQSFLDFQLYYATFSRGQWWEHPGWEPAWTALLAARDLCRRHGARLVVVTAPSKGSVYLPRLAAAYSPRAFDDFVARRGVAPPPGASWHEAFLAHRSELTALLTELLAAEGIDHVDLRPSLEAAAAAGDEPYLPFDSHWSATGNRLAGELVAAELRRLY